MGLWGQDPAQPWVTLTVVAGHPRPGGWLLHGRSRGANGDDVLRGVSRGFFMFYFFTFKKRVSFIYCFSDQLHRLIGKKWAAIYQKGEKLKRITARP